MHRPTGLRLAAWLGIQAVNLALLVRWWRRGEYVAFGMAAAMTAGAVLLVWRRSQRPPWLADDPAPEEVLGGLAPELLVRASLISP